MWSSTCSPFNKWALNGMCFSIASTNGPTDQKAGDAHYQKRSKNEKESGFMWFPRLSVGRWRGPSTAKRMQLHPDQETKMTYWAGSRAGMHRPASWLLAPRPSRSHGGLSRKPESREFRAAWLQVGWLEASQPVRMFPNILIRTRVTLLNSIHGKDLFPPLTFLLSPQT